MESRNERLSLECSISAREGSSSLSLPSSLSFLSFSPSSMALGWVTTKRRKRGGFDFAVVCPGKASSFSMCLTCRIRYVGTRRIDG